MNYKEYRGEKYISSFPDEWLLLRVNGTGPDECASCKHYGSINNIFIGYCKNCAETVYKYERGDGFDRKSEEILLEGNSILPNYLEGERYKIIEYIEKNNNLHSVEKLFIGFNMEN